MTIFTTQKSHKKIPQPTKCQPSKPHRPQKISKRTKMQTRMERLMSEELESIK